MTPPPDMVSGARLLVSCLKAQHVDHCFQVAGESFLAVLDALIDVPEIAVTVCRQEGGAAMMAVAYGKLTGRPGICMVTRGPGTTNASAGLHIARQDATPMILFIGQVARSMRGREAFQEIEYRRMLGEVTKWVAEIDRPERIPEIISRAFHVACNGRPGPVAIALPEDMLAEMTHAAAPAAPPAPLLSGISEADAEHIVDLICKAVQPMLIVGGGVWSQDAKSALEHMAAAWKIPVAASFRRQDFFDNQNPNYAGDVGIGINPALAQRIREADLLILLGTRLGEMESDGYTLLDIPAPKQTVIHIYPDPDEIGAVYRPAIGVVASPVHVVQSLAARRPPTDMPASRDRHVADARREYERWTMLPKGVGAIRMPDVMRCLARRLPKDAIITNGAGNYTTWVHRFHRYRDFGTQLAPISGSMGFGLPAAVAAARVHPERTVICFAGDGCLLMHGQEMATATQYGLKIIVLVVNNGMYGTIRMHQEKTFPGRVNATELVNPDFALLAQAYGFHGETVATSDAFPAAFERALAHAGPASLELPVDPEALTPDRTLSDIRAAAVTASRAK